MQEAFALGRVLEYWSAKLPPGRLSHHLPQIWEEKSCVLSRSSSALRLECRLGEGRRSLAAMSPPGPRNGRCSVLSSRVLCHHH